MSREICEPRVLFDPACGQEHVYYCGKTLAMRNVASRAERCLGGTFICARCFDDFDDFMDRAGNARAREKEWEGG